MAKRTVVNSAKSQSVAAIAAAEALEEEKLRQKKPRKLAPKKKKKTVAVEEDELDDDDDDTQAEEINKITIECVAGHIYLSVVFTQTLLAHIAGPMMLP